MLKTSLKGIISFYPFDADYIKVAKAKETQWNLMDRNGKLISDNWFSNISKNNDGSIVTSFLEGTRKQRHVATVTFADVPSIATSVAVKKIVPLSTISFLDVGSVAIITGNRKYVAKATLYGYVVFIDSKGKIYDGDGNPMDIKISTVDAERLHKAINRFNKKLHYTCNLDNDADTIQSLYENNVASWCFYFLTDKLSASSGDGLKIRVNAVTTTKWTDKIVFRAIKNLMPDEVRSALMEKFGDLMTIKCSKNGDLEWDSWDVTDRSIDYIVDTLDSI